jgi:ubiquitin C-terminal hydrolase
LSSIVCHHGSTEGGHYVSYLKDDKEDQWYLFDDTTVRKISDSYIQGPEDYMLMYVLDEAED